MESSSKTSKPKTRLSQSNNALRSGSLIKKKSLSIKRSRYSAKSELKSDNATEGSESSDEIEIFASSDSDPDIEMSLQFDEEEAHKQLLSFHDCTILPINVDEQRAMGLEIGINVTSEQPWKQIKKEVLEDYIETESEIVKNLKKKLSHMEFGRLLLVGYAPTLSEEEDTFLIFETNEAGKLASEIIQRQEAYHRLKAKKSLIKYPRKWKSKGSELEVNRVLPVQRTNIVDVEIQSVYPLNHSTSTFTLRKVEDVRDGYVELVPGRTKYENIQRKRLEISVQVAPPRIDIEQQTDPTFPMNAWSQYFYEIIKEEPEPDKEDDEENENVKKALEPVAEEKIKLSNQVEELLKTLEFNTVDMYRNDYPFIGTKKVPKYNVPYMKQKFCFADISKSHARIVSSIDWHPNFSGIAIASYAFVSKNTIANLDDKTDIIKRIVLESNPVLMWSFDDVLDPKLEFFAPREVQSISFCPYDENILIGGCMNGQIIIWDLKGRIEKVEFVEILTPAQANYRSQMQHFMLWTKQANQYVQVRPAALSALKNSHQGPITSIKWLSRYVSVTTTGQIRSSDSPKNRFFVTASLDCQIAFWNLDSDQITGGKKGLKKPQKNMPPELLEEVSPFKVVHGVYRPHFMIIFNKPITSMIIDSPFFMYEPKETAKLYKRKTVTRVSHTIMDEKPSILRNKIIIGTILGEIYEILWEGFDFDQGTEVNIETIHTSKLYPYIHDNRIVKVERNPFVPELFISVGGYIFAVWDENSFAKPVFWRYRGSKLTEVEWSRKRPGVFYLTLDDGSVEAWDLISRTDAPCLNQSLAGELITALKQHKLTLPESGIAIGDFNSSLRILLIPSVFNNELPNECERLRAIVSHELGRKNLLLSWNQMWFEKFKDIRDAKQKAAEEAQEELERLIKEEHDLQEIQLRKEEQETKKREAREKKKMVFDLPEQLEKKWDEMNFKRLMKLLMSRRRVDPELLAKQTKPAKAQDAYNARKEQAIKNSFLKIDEDVSAVRARLLPVEVENVDREIIVDKVVTAIIAEEDDDYFDNLEKEALDYIENNLVRQSLMLPEILYRGRQRREVINKSLGGNTAHRHQYKQLKDNRRYHTDYANKDEKEEVNEEELNEEVNEEVINEEVNEEVINEDKIKEVNFI